MDQKDFIVTCCPHTQEVPKEYPLVCPNEKERKHGQVSDNMHEYAPFHTSMSIKYVECHNKFYVEPTLTILT